MEKDIECKWKPKKAGIAMLVSDKILQNGDCSKRQRRKLHNNNTVKQEDITFVSMYPS